MIASSNVIVGGLGDMGDMVDMGGIDIDDMVVVI
jgi:hypothetical protein